MRMFLEEGIWFNRREQREGRFEGEGGRLEQKIAKIAKIAKGEPENRRGERY
jgi:hypothetical protein